MKLRVLGVVVSYLFILTCLCSLICWCVEFFFQKFTLFHVWCRLKCFKTSKVVRCSWKWLKVVIQLNLSFWYWSILEVQMVVSSTNENKSQIIKTYYIINIITSTYYKSFWKIWILFCGYKSFDVYNSLLIQIQFIIMKFKVCKSMLKALNCELHIK